MKTLSFKTLVPAIIIVFSLISCNDDKDEYDSNWPPMKWEVTNRSKEDINISDNYFGISGYVIDVNYKGGELLLECVNYKAFRILSVDDYIPDNDENRATYINDWCRLSIEDNILHCIFRTDMSNKPQEQINLTLSAGDVFQKIRINRTFGEPATIGL